jgi:DNA-binding PadR family transcriptional regulator
MGSRRGLPLEKVLLGFLSQEAAHGYDLHQAVQDELGEVWYMGLSNVYRALGQMEACGEVEVTVVPQDDRPARKVYHITPLGRQSLLSWLRRPIPSMRDMRVEFPAKLYFFRRLELEGAEDLIAAQEATCRSRMEMLEQRAAECPPGDFNRLVFDFRRRQIAAIVEWLQVCREERT